MPSKLKARFLYFGLVFTVLIFDRWTKWLIDARLLLNQTISVIDGLFNITYVRNTGVAFGIFDPIRSPLKSTVLAILTIVAAIGVALYSWRTPVDQKLMQVALSLIFAGALGNLYDRVHYGYVVDFIEVYLRTYRWPAFNIADSAITTGVALLAIELFRRDTHDSSNPA